MYQVDLVLVQLYMYTYFFKNRLMAHGLTHARYMHGGCLSISESWGLDRMRIIILQAQLRPDGVPARLREHVSNLVRIRKIGTSATLAMYIMVHQKK